MKKAISTWRSHKDWQNGIEFDLGHLNSQTIEIVQAKKAGKPERRTPCHLTFSHHCFTRKPGDEESFSTDQIYNEPSNERRLFCHDRYALSKSVLVGLVNNKFTDGKTKCFHTKRGTFLLIETLDENGNQISYEVYFDIFKSTSLKNGVYINIRTAFVRDSRQGRRLRSIPKISLEVLAYKRVMNKHIPTRR